MNNLQWSRLYSHLVIMATFFWPGKMATLFLPSNPCWCGHLLIRLMVTIQIPEDRAVIKRQGLGISPRLLWTWSPAMFKGKIIEEKWNQKNPAVWFRWLYSPSNLKSWWQPYKEWNLLYFHPVNTATHAKFRNSKCLWLVHFIELYHLIIKQPICVYLVKRVTGTLSTLLALAGMQNKPVKGYRFCFSNHQRFQRQSKLSLLLFWF